jgi:outer membrane protein assembly factor BamB
VADGRVFVTDRITEPTQRERVFSFRWDTGALLWSYEYDCPYRDVSYTAGPRASVTVHDGLAYALGTMGHLHCFEADSGKIVWKKDLDALYQIRMPIWGIAGSPVVYEDLVVIQVGGENNACLVAFDRKTGKERWRALEDRAGYSTPIVVERGGRSILICWTADNVVGLDPASGKLQWSYAYPPKNMPLAIAAPVVQGDRLFVTGFYEGSLMLRLSDDGRAVEKVWEHQGPSERETAGLHALISTPIFEGEYIYGIDSHGELRCLKAANGQRIWENLEIVPTARWSTAHLIRNNRNIWIFNERGELLITSMSPQGVQIKSRAQLIEPTRDQLNRRGGVAWAHPAFAYRHVFARNDRELICASLEQ